MAISMARLGQKVTIGVVGQLGGADREELQRLVSEQLAEDAVEFIVDFADDGFIDSRGLGGLVAAAKKIRKHGAQLRVTNLNGDLRRLFEMTRLDEFFDFEPDGGPRAA
jgi:anti-anti-sigma factor